MAEWFRAVVASSNSWSRFVKTGLPPLPPSNYVYLKYYFPLFKWYACKLAKSSGFF